MQTEILEQIIRLPLPERIEIMERISQSIQEDRQNAPSDEPAVKRRREAIHRLRGVGKIEGEPAPTDDEAKAEYYKYISEKYK
jgi:hypothetical protein